MRALIPLALTCLVFLPENPTAQQAQKKRTIHPAISTTQASYDLETRRAQINPLSRKSATERFCYINTDFGWGYVTPGETNSETLIDWGVMGGTASTICSTLSSIVTRFNFAYGTSSADMSVGGPGAALTMSFYTGYEGWGEDSGNCPVATFGFTGLPGFSGRSTGIGASYFVTVDLSGGLELCLPTGSIALGFASSESSNNGNGFANTGPEVCWAANSIGHEPEPTTGTWNAADIWLPDTKGTSGGTFFFNHVFPFTSFYWAIARADLSGSPATVATRNAGTNPSSYSGSVAALGGTYTAAVDNSLAGQAASRLIALDSAFVFELGDGQFLTCFDLGGTGELWSGAGLTPSAPVPFGTDVYVQAMPKNLLFCGFFLCSFSIQFGSPPFVLSNSQDLTVGG